MAHKRVEKATLARLDEQIAHAKASIQRIRDVSAFGSDGKKKICEFLKDMADTAGHAKDDVIRAMGLGQKTPDAATAVIWAGSQENAYRNILEVLSDPEKVISFYENELKEMNQQRDYYQTLERATE